MPTLHQRSVINMGQGSYVITLPRAWLRYFGIRPGDKLEIVTDDELVIRLPKRRKLQTHEKKGFKGGASIG